MPQPRDYPEQHDVPELQDAALPLRRWMEIVDALLMQFGPEAIMTLDAGHNNVSVKIET